MTLDALPPVTLTALPYSPERFAFNRRRTHVVMVGDVGVGGDNPIRVQSMTTTRTQDVEATVAQAERLVRRRLRDRAHHRADRPGREGHRRDPDAAARAAASTCRWSPTSTSARPPRWRPPTTSRRCASTPATSPTPSQFAVREYTDAEYDAELERIEERFTPLVLQVQGSAASRCASAPTTARSPTGS